MMNKVSACKNTKTRMYVRKQFYQEVGASKNEYNDRK